MNPALIITGLDAGSLTLVKLYSLNKQLPYLYAATTLYALVPYFFVQAMKTTQGVAVTNLLWNAMSTLLVTAIGVLYFKETFKIPQIIGGALIIAGIIIINK